MAAIAGSRTLEVTVRSAEDLTIDQKPVTKDVFVEVRAESINCSTSSPVTADGAGGNLSWNETLMVEMPAHAQSITFEVKCKTSVGSKSVGIARIALSDLLGPIVSEDCSQPLSYQLRDWNGRPNGIVNFSVRVKSTTPEYQSEDASLYGAEDSGVQGRASKEFDWEDSEVYTKKARDRDRTYEM